VTQLYDDELRPGGLRVPQFTLLKAIDQVGSVRQGELGDLLALDSTTLTRTLKRLHARGWIRGFPGTDRRERHWELTPAGSRQLERVTPLWERAQRRLRDTLGEGQWDTLQAILSRATLAARRA
jgi:DNA-binding MarR family transcriptional regulator